MRRNVAALTSAVLFAFALVTTSGRAGPPNVKGKITGFEKLVPEVYAEAAKPDARRWTWREPSPSVAAQFRVLSANPSRDVCIAATTGANQERKDFLMTVTGGRVFPTTIVVTPNTTLAFKNFDPFKHRIYVMSATGQKLLQAEDLQPNAVRKWAAQGPGRYEIRDELFPSIRTFVVVDPQVVEVAYPGRDGAFAFNLPSGEYVLKAFFNGKAVGKQINFTAKDRGVVELKEPLKLDEGTETEMMILSRIWYVILAILLAAAYYIVALAVGQYNRRNQAAMEETLKADSQVVSWAMQVDARRRLDVLLLAAVDPSVAKAIRGANGKEAVPPGSKEEGAEALRAFNEKLPPEYKNDVLFVADREGRLVAQVGYDAVNGFAEFELGGYPAVFDALHGFLRDDTWVWGGRIARVVARPVEDEVGQPPLGAVIALRWIDTNFTKEIGKRTRTNIAFFALGQRVASAATTDGFDEKSLEALGSDLKAVGEDKGFKENGRTDVRPLGPTGDEKGGVLFVRLPGDASELGGGFAVARAKVAINTPTGFLAGADDTDKKNVKLWLVGVIFAGAALFGFLFSFLEHSMPMREMRAQAEKLKHGQIDTLQLPRFRGGYRAIATDINAGVQRVVEKGGGMARKPADLESILGPVPAQPNMSAFSFPLRDASAPPQPIPQVPGGSHSGPSPSGGTANNARFPGPPPHPGSRPGPPPAPATPGGSFGPERTMAMPGVPPPAGGYPGAPPPPVPSPALGVAASAAAATAKLGAPQGPPAPFPPGKKLPKDEEEQTMVAQPSADLINAASGPYPAAVDPLAEWQQVYEEFIRTKRECGEPIDGLTFEKFQQTLKKNRDALMQRHGCKRVKFSVYVKEGRASLKATPVRD